MLKLGKTELGIELVQASLVDALDDDDDVQTVWGNYEISDEVMEAL